ncbi:hypothetical protein [Sporosarcina sp. USHLN248]|uniref:hypothetical protein n=1 Tax=Sporosarcina sp. USHLN248 TaxID=3081300 RepID=UPI00301B1704
MKSIVYEEKDFLLGDKFVRIVQGFDHLFKQMTDDNASKEEALNSEGIVPVNLTMLKPETYTSLEDVYEDLVQLQHEYRTIQDERRRFYMNKQIESIKNLVLWKKKDLNNFLSRVRGFLFVNDNPFTSAQCANLHEELQVHFKSIGLSGDLSSNYGQWTASRHVPLDEIESVLNELLCKAKERVVEKMFPEVEDIHIKVKIVHDVPYSAYCDYVNETMIINGDLDYTYESLKHLATHEVFPGHTTHLYVREQAYLRGEVPADAALVITNSASSPLFEGIGDNGLQFIDWMTTDHDRIADTVQRIKSVAGMNSSYMLNELNRPEQEVREFLRSFAFGQQEWIDSRMRFISHPLRAPFIYAYYRGYEGVKEAYKRIPDSQKKEFYYYLYQNMLTAEELQLYG